MLNVRHQKDNTVVYPEASLSNHRDVHETTYSDSFAQEFKSPLDTMLGMLDLLLTTTMSIKQREYIEVACSSGRTLMSLVDSMLTFSEIKSGQIKLAEQKCHLKEIPVDVLKIDRLFIRGIETNPEDQAIVKSIVNLARELNIKTVAEGVETMEQKAILAKLNCHSFQGFLISKPLSPDSFSQQFLKS